MAVPQRKTNQARKRKRRLMTPSGRSFTPSAPVAISDPPYSICDVCGTYRGRALLAVEEF